MSELSLKFKVQSLKASFLATLTFKLFTASYLHSLAFICGLGLCFTSPLVTANNTQPDIRELDRMFTTRFERAQLDALRRRMNNGESIESDANAQISTPPSNVEMQGIMQREHGGNVAWVNGQSTLKSNHIDEHIRVTGQPQALRGASINIDGQVVRLKPGQVWEPGTGKIVESYKTKVATPVTKGAAETVPDVQTETTVKELPKTDALKMEPAKPETDKAKP